MGGSLAVFRSLSSCSIIRSFCWMAAILALLLMLFGTTPGASPLAAAALGPPAAAPAAPVPAVVGVSFLHTGASWLYVTTFSSTKRTTSGRPNAGFPFIAALAFSAS